MPAFSGQTSNLDSSLTHSDLLIEKAVEEGIIESPVIPGRRFRIPGDAVDQARSERAVASGDAQEKTELQHPVAVAVSRQAWTGMKPSQLAEGFPGSRRVARLECQQQEVFVDRNEIGISLQRSLESGQGFAVGMTK
jgi:hypothetical protein